MSKCPTRADLTGVTVTIHLSVMAKGELFAICNERKISVPSFIGELVRERLTAEKFRDWRDKSTRKPALVDDAGRSIDDDQSSAESVHG